MVEQLTGCIQNMSIQNCEFKAALNILIKYEIQCLLQRLSDTGEEAIVITTSLSDSCQGYYGSVKGVEFLHSSRKLGSVKEEFMKYCEDQSGFENDNNGNELQEDANYIDHRPSRTVNDCISHDDCRKNQCSILSKLDNTNSQMPVLTKEADGSKTEIIPAMASCYNVGQPDNKSDIVPKITAKLKQSASSTAIKHLTASYAIQQQPLVGTSGVKLNPNLSKLKDVVGTAIDKICKSNARIIQIEKTKEDKTKDFEASFANSSTNHNKTTQYVSLKKPDRKELGQANMDKTTNAINITNAISPASAGIAPKVYKIKVEKIRDAAGISLIGTLKTCYICRQEFPNYDALKGHMSLHIESDQDVIHVPSREHTQSDHVFCGICDFKCLPEEMKNHMKFHELCIENKNDKTCPTVMFKGNNEDVQYDHIRNKELQQKDKTVKCGICDKMVIKKNMVVHIADHNKMADAQSLEHLYSEIKETDSDDNNDSINNENETSRKLFLCNKCCYQSRRRCRMKEHVQTCQKCPQFGCEICGKVFPAKRYYLQHKKLSNGSKAHGACSVKKIKICTNSDFKTSTQLRMKDHLKKCGGSSYKCKHCGKAFIAKRNLLRHEKIHKGAVFTCDKCGYCTERHDRLKEHKESCLSVEKTYHCEICDKWFKTRKVLKAHLKRHRIQNSLVDLKMEKEEHFSYQGSLSQDVSNISYKIDRFDNTQLKTFGESDDASNDSSKQSIIYLIDESKFERKDKLRNISMETSSICNESVAEEVMKDISAMQAETDSDFEED